MNTKFGKYVRKRREIQKKSMIKSLKDSDWMDDDWLDDIDQEIMQPERKIDFVDVTKLGTFILIGGGIGLLSGVAAIAVSASVAEVVIGGVVTKVAGAVGGAAGLGIGLSSIDKKNKRFSKKG